MSRKPKGKNPPDDPIPPPSDSIASDAAQRQAAEMQTAILNAIPAHIALVDARGVILSVNDAWREFARSQGLNSPDWGVGCNYFEVCDRASDTFAAATSVALRGVLDGQQAHFALEYPCHSPTEPRWFRLMITPVSADRRAGAVVMHIDITERRLAENALRESEQHQRQLAQDLELEKSRLEAAQSVARIGSWQTDLLTLEVIWSAETHRIFETSPADFKPTHEKFLAMIYPDDRERVDQAFWQSLKTLEAHVIGHRLLLADGTIKHVEERWQVFCDGQNRPVRAVGTCQDITERALADQLIADEQRFNRTLLEASPMAIIAYEASGEGVTANAASVRMLGAPDVEAVCRQNFREIEVWQRTGLLAAADEVLATGRPCEREIRSVSSFGKDIWLHCRLIPLTYGGKIYLLGFFDDIRERKLAEEQRDRLFNLSVDMFCIAGFDGCLQQVNPAWTDCLGWTKEELISRPMMAFIHPDDHEATTSIRRQIHAGNPVRGFENRYRCRDGSYRWFSWNVFPVPEARQVFGVARDATASRAAAAQRVRANEILTGIVEALQEIAASDLGLGDLMQLMAARAQALTGAAGGVVELVEGAVLRYQVGSGALADQSGLTMPLDDSLSGLAVKTAKSLVCGDAETDARVNRTACRQAGVRSLVVVPLRVGTAIIGVLKVVSGQPGAFSETDAANLQILAESLGAVIQRLRSAEQLRASEEQYRMLFASNPHPMWTYDVETRRFLAVNEAAVRHYGYSEEEFLGMTIHSIRPPEDAAVLERKLETMDVRRKSSGHWRHRKKTGEEIEVEVSSDAVVFNGRPARLVLAHDITARVRSERELARSTRALQMLSQCNEVLIRAEDEKKLLAGICELAIRIGGFRLAWVGYSLDDEARSIVPQARAGSEDGYLETIKLTWDENRPGGNGPAARAIRTGQAVMVADLADESSGFQSVAEAQARGYTGVVCLPLKADKGNLGILALYVGGGVTLPADEVTLLQELADNLAFGIHSLRGKIERRQTNEVVLAAARGIAASTGAEFFEKLTHTMVESMGAWGGCVARFDSADQDTVLTLCAVAAGRSLPNYRYPLSGRPCEKLGGQDFLIIPRRLQELYPGFAELGAPAVEAYIGTRLLNARNRPIGVLYLLFRETPPRTEFIASILKIFASRAAAELERQTAESRTREQAALIDQAPDAILVRGLDDQIIFWSKGAERIYGWTEAEAVGRKVGTLLNTDPEKAREALAAVVQTGEWSGELKKHTKAGTPLTVDCRWTLLRDEDGRPKSILTVDTDVTERTKLEQQFLRAQRMESIGTLAGGIAHDLNNLLAPITMGVELLRMFDPNPKSLPIIDNMERSARRGASLVRQVLSFARGVEGSRVPLQIKHIIREVESIVENTFPKNITMEVHPGADLWLVMADPTQLNQVLLNLCVNARDAMPSGGHLVITAKNVEIDRQYAVMNKSIPPGRYLEIEVTDSGCGMTQETIDRIFEPFFTTKEIGKGTGLGLSTVLGIVRGHGGFVNVYSEVGKGSVFKVWLPAQPEGTVAPADHVAEDKLPRGHGELILVVDDEKSVLDITMQTLESFGYRVVGAEDGAQAIATYALQREQIELVITDMMMPVMDGSALITAIQRINPRAVIIAASGLAVNSHVAKATGSGVKHFLSKPYSAEVLLTLVKKALARGLSQPPM